MFNADVKILGAPNPELYISECRDDSTEHITADESLCDAVKESKAKAPFEEFALQYFNALLKFVSTARIKIWILQISMICYVFS